MADIESWLETLATESLPGGVAATALAAAMGAALISKTVRITLDRQSLSAADRAMLEDLLPLAHRQRAELVRLSNADERAYRAVLETWDLPDLDPARRQAWQAAIEVPICIAEICQSLLIRLPSLLDSCWPAVRSDLKAGIWLLLVGMRVGIHAAEANLRARGDNTGTEAHRARVDALVQALTDTSVLN